MSGYYLRLAISSLGRSPILSALMVLAIGLGIGASITTLTVLHLLSGDPIPRKSSVLYYPQLQPMDVEDPKSGHEPPGQLSYIDAMNLLAARRGERQAVMVHGSVALYPEGGISPFYADARYTTADFFGMFATPFFSGGPWNAADDEARAQVAVISRRLASKLFGGEGLGRTLQIKDQEFRVVGVMDDWRPKPRFYDLTTEQYGPSEDVFVPFLTSRALKLGSQGSVSCWGKDNFDTDHMETAPCVWLQFWVELDSSEKARDYLDFLGRYSEEQKSLGRFQLPPNVRLRGLMGWLAYRHVVPGDVRLQVWLAAGFLAVCLLNTVGLLLAKFLRRSAEISVRRALGASRRAVFAQFLFEAGAIGFAGGGLGLLLSLAGLWAIRQQRHSYADLAHLDAQMFVSTFALAVLASLAAGLLPAWRACRVPPALQLKAN